MLNIKYKTTRCINNTDRVLLDWRDTNSMLIINPIVDIAGRNWSY